VRAFGRNHGHRRSTDIAGTNATDVFDFHVFDLIVGNGFLSFVPRKAAPRGFWVTGH
jgi:hypothetical protein